MIPILSSTRILAAALFLALPFLIFHAGAVEQRLRGIPFYEIFDEKDIGDSTASYSITSSPNGTLYLCNESGIYTYDGTSWKQLIETHSTTEKVRCITWTEHGIFVGGYSRVSLLEFTKSNGVVLNPLHDGPIISDSSDVFTKVDRLGDKLYFSGSASIATLDLETLNIKSSVSRPWIKATTVYKDQLLISINEQGLAVLEDNQFSYLAHFKKFSGKDCISDFATSEDGDLFFSTQSGQVYQTSATGSLSTEPTLIFDSEDTVSSLVSINQNELALAIPSRGLVVIDTDGNQTSSIETSLDFRWRGCEKLHLDQDGTLWVLFSFNSVGKVLVNNPLTEIDERLRPNLFYPLAFNYQEQSYIVNEGKLYRSQHGENGELLRYKDALPNFEGSVAIAIQQEDEVIVIADQTAYSYQGDSLTQLGHVGKIERIDNWNTDSSYFFGAAPTGATLLKRSESGVEIVDHLPFENDLVNKIAQTESGVFWLEIGLGSLIKVEIVDDQIQLKNYSKEDGSPPNWVAVWEHEGEVLFTERSGVFEYNEETDRIVRSERFAEYFPPNSGSIHRISTDPNGNIWASYHLSNYILWKQDDGSYKMESQTLAQMSGLFANQYSFLSNGDALILTGNGIYHVDSSKIQTADPKGEFLDLEEITDSSGIEIHFVGLGTSLDDYSFDLPNTARSLTFAVKASFSDTIQLPEYQYALGGLSDKWSKWSDSNHISFNNLEHGHYQLQVRTRRPNGDIVAERSIAFSIAPTFWETPVAKILYIVSALATLFAGYRILLSNLKSANLRLEQMVAERTRELGQKNAQLKQNAERLQATLDELREAQDQIVATSRKAGMAEVATNVLHNVGNVLNSINVGITSLKKRIQHQRVWKLSKIAELVKSRQDDLPEFFATDKRGQAIPEYLEKLAEVLIDDLQSCQMEIECMDENVDHVKKIIATQQSHAKVVDASQLFDLAELIESAISMIIGDLDRAILELNTNIEPNLKIYSDKHSVLQMVANFIKNAKESIIEAQIPLGLINISANRSDDGKSVYITISDNGVGISKENLQKIFSHGFTTKDEGHGFGMHSSANSAKSLGGELSIDSDGLGHGATVTLTLPTKREPRNDLPAKRWTYKSEGNLSRN